MITDDPGTPGNGHWENNLAVAFDHRPHETCGTCRRSILNLRRGRSHSTHAANRSAILQRSGHGVIGGLGGTEAAVKWRFLDEERNGFDMSMFPRVIFNIAQSSVRRGLADDGTRFQIPFQVAKNLDRSISISNSVRSRALSAAANGFMESWAAWSWRKRQC